MAAALVISAAAAAVLVISDKKETARPVTEIRRNSYGEGGTSRILRMKIDGEEADSLEIEVDEKRYTSDEIRAVFHRASEKLEPLILGENERLDEVRSDLKLVTEIPGEPVDVSWELDRYDLVNIYGELNEKALEEEPEGVIVKLKACMIYREDESMRALEEMNARIFPPKMTGREKSAAQVSRVIAKEEERTREEDVLRLPGEVDGRKVELRNPDNPRGWYVLAMGPIVCLLLVSLQKQNEQKEKEERERQMMLDYPEIMNKLTLLLGAGMTVKKAWEKIVQDYERQKENLGERRAYEEMSIAFREMQSGVTESESYERFGRRCGLKAYRKLVSLLDQNLRKGTKGLTALLAAESQQAFEERKAAAKRKGEEAGTKLLAPMFFMLAMVLVIVIIPAFLSIKM